MKQSLAKLRGAVANRMGDSSSGDYLVTIGSQAKLLSYRWVMVIFGLLLFYNLVWVSDRYVTEARAYVKSTNEKTAITPALPLVAGGFGGASQDALLLQSYIHSADMLNALEEKLGLRAHFTSSEWDFFSRMSSDATDEEFLEYFQSRVSVLVEIESNILTIEGQGFTAEFSQQLVEAILAQSEAYINGVSQQIALQEIAFVERELDRARQAVEAGRSAMLQFQAENELLDPAATGAAIQTVINEMEGELVRLEAEEKSLSSFLQGDAAELVAVRARIDGIKDQLDQERGQFASGDNDSINRVNAEFEELKLAFEFASDIYRGGLQTLEQARVESYRKLKHLVIVQSARTPDEALMPYKLYNLVTLFVVLNLVYGIVAMIIATIREHRDV